MPLQGKTVVAGRSWLHLPRIPALELLSCNGPPPSISLELLPCPLDLQGWVLNGHLEGSSIHFDNTDFASIATPFRIDRDKVQFPGATVTTADGSEFTMDLAVQYSPLRIHLTNGTLVGTPEFVETFIPPRTAKQICRECSVRAECLEFAIVSSEKFGIWGAMSERERRKIRRERQIAARHRRAG